MIFDEKVIDIRIDYLFCFAMLKRTILIANPAYVSTKLEQLIIQPRNSPNAHQVPIEDIAVVLLEHPEITISQAVIVKLITNNVAIIHCDAKHMPVGLVMPLESNTLQSARFSAQILASVPLKKQLWQQTIVSKIQNQATLLSLLGKDPKALHFKAQQVKSGDTSNQEGQAAKIYWSAIFSPIVFQRERFGYPPNNLLNYGYAILRAAVARALVGSGLLPTLGIHHHNKYNAFCLADDIMEPYRPFVDLIVAKIVDKDEMGQYELTTKTKSDLLGVLTADVQLNKQTSPLMVALSHTTASLVRCFEGEAKEICYPKLG